MSDNREERISELELTIEEMERTHSILYGILLGVIWKTTFGGWVWPGILGVSIAFIHWRFLAKRPFTRGAGRGSGTE